MVFVSYRVTTGTLEGKREVRGARRAVITSGPLNSVEIDTKQTMASSIILGSVTIVFDANFHDDTCPLASIKKGLDMFVLPKSGGQVGKLSLNPGDKMYSVNGRTGSPTRQWSSCPWIWNWWKQRRSIPPDSTYCPTSRSRLLRTSRSD